MLADITVDKKAVRNKFFTYRVPKKLKPLPGSLVLVPFHGQRVVGVINSIQKDEPKGFKIREIESIIYPWSLHNKNQIKLASFIAKKYFSPISAVIFVMLPHYLRTLKSSKKILEILKPEVESSQKKIIRKPPKYLLFDPLRKYSLKIYQKAIKQALSRKETTIFLVPDLELPVVNQIKCLSKKSIILNKDNNSDKELFLKWQTIREGKIDLVIGSHLALFAPLKNLGLIIVHQENDQYYKNDQLPKYHLREVATELARLNNAALILQAEIPSLESCQKVISRSLKLIPYKNFEVPLGLQGRKKIKVIDLKNERGLFSLETLKTIEQNIKKRKKTLLFLNRKGFSRLYICRDCGYSKHIKSNEAAPAICPKCKSSFGREHSFGTKRLEFELQKLFPKAKILRVDKENTVFKNLKIKIKKSDIIIATSFIFKLNYIFDSVIIMLAEIGLSLPDYKNEEELFYTLFRALRLGKDKIIQTFYPEHQVIKFLLNNNFKEFLDEQLSLRKTNHYPPFSTIIRLTIEGKKAKKEASNLAEDLKKLNSSYNSPNEILGPAPVFIQPKAKYKVEILLKGKNPYPLLSLVPDNWKVDVDPVELLK